MICCTEKLSNLKHIHDHKYMTNKYISYNSLREKKKLGMTTLGLTILHLEQQLNLINLKIRWRNDDKRTQFTVY